MILLYYPENILEDSPCSSNHQLGFCSLSSFCAPQSFDFYAQPRKVNGIHLFISLYKLILSRGYATLHHAMVVGRSVGQSCNISWILSGFRIIASAQPSTTGLPYIRPCWFRVRGRVRVKDGVGISFRVRDRGRVSVKARVGKVLHVTIRFSSN